MDTRDVYSLLTYYGRWTLCRSAVKLLSGGYGHHTNSIRPKRSWPKSLEIDLGIVQHMHSLHTSLIQQKHILYSRKEGIPRNQTLCFITRSRSRAHVHSFSHSHSLRCLCLTWGSFALTAEQKWNKDRNKARPHTGLGLLAGLSALVMPAQIIYFFL